jgi:mono/diheme cytochrome c family protein
MICAVISGARATARPDRLRIPFSKASGARVDCKRPSGSERGRAAGQPDRLAASHKSYSLLTPLSLTRGSEERNDQIMSSVIRNLTLFCVLTPAVWAADAAAGKVIFAAKCKTCHGADGTPGAAFAKMGVKPMNDAAIQGKSDGDLKTAILKGVGKMKAQQISDADADNVVAAVRTMK